MNEEGSGEIWGSKVREIICFEFGERHQGKARGRQVLWCGVVWLKPKNELELPGRVVVWVEGVRVK